jgi:ribonuclease D
VPVENLLQPDALRRLCWTPPSPADAAGIAEFLRGRGAREWQVGLLAEGLERAFAEAAREPV